MRISFLTAFLVCVAATARAAVITVTPDASIYAVGQTITVTIVGDSQGGSAVGIYGRLLYSSALTDPSGIAPTQSSHTHSAGIPALGVDTGLEQGEGYGPLGGYAEAFNQIFSVVPVGVDQITVSEVKLVAAAVGTLEMCWEVPPDLLGNGLHYFGATPACPTVTIPEPGTTLTLAIGVLGLLASPRVRSRAR